MLLRNKKTNSLSFNRKINSIHHIIFITFFRKRDGFWRAKYIKKHQIFHYFGENNYYEPKTLPSDSFLVSIHNNVRISFGVTFITHDIFSQMFNQMPECQKLGKYTVHFAPIEVFDNVCIGGDVVIMPGVKIGPNAIVAGGSVVTKNVTEGSIVGGNPAKVIGSVMDLAKKRANSNEPYWNSSRETFEAYYWGKKI